MMKNKKYYNVPLVLESYSYWVAGTPKEVSFWVLALQMFAQLGSAPAHPVCLTKVEAWAKPNWNSDSKLKDTKGSTLPPQKFQSSNTQCYPRLCIGGHHWRGSGAKLHLFSASRFKIKGQVFGMLVREKRRSTLQWSMFDKHLLWISVTETLWLNFETAFWREQRCPNPPPPTK
jgi:hypothetical protein